MQMITTTNNDAFRGDDDGDHDYGMASHSTEMLNNQYPIFSPRSP